MTFLGPGGDWPTPRRVDEDVAILIPHRPGCADFPLPVLHGRASLAASSAIRCCFVDRFVRLKVLSRVSHQRFSPHGAPLSSIGSQWVRFPDVIGLIEALRLPACASPVTYCFASGAHATLLVRVPLLALALPEGQRMPSGPGSLLSRRPNCRRALTWTRAGSLRFPGDPSYAFASVKDPGRTDDPSPIDGFVDAAPTVSTVKASALWHFGAIARLQHLLPTLHEWCCHYPCKARFRLAGSPLPGGSRTLWIAMKGFRLHFHPPFLDFS